MAHKLPYSKPEYFQFLEETLKPQPVSSTFLDAFQKRLSERQQGKTFKPVPRVPKL